VGFLCRIFRYGASLLSERKIAVASFVRGQHGLVLGERRRYSKLLLYPSFWKDAGTGVHALFEILYGHEIVFWCKHEGREISAFTDPIEQSGRHSGAERRASAGGYLADSTTGFLIRRS
jgi:hypothetical protein